MRYVVVGLGNIGEKRRAALGERCVATIDPFNPAADHASPQDCPSDTYDAAVLAVPNHSKPALMQYFLGLGKHVLVEKPLLFPASREADCLEQLARDNRATWYTSYNHRFEPSIAALKQRLDAGAIGRLYHGRLFYGNGTVANVAGSWRDAGLGVIEDLGCHLLDLAGFLLGCRGSSFTVSAQQSCESASPDHAVLVSAQEGLTLEVTFLSWKNSFSIDLYGERGSLHVDGLAKWGRSELIERQRVRPSGPPHESRQVAGGPDLTWARDLEYFETLVESGLTSAENDRWISQTLRVACAQ